MKKRTDTKRKTQKIIQRGDNISHRPEKANNREEFGHWEGDLIVGARNTSKEALFTIIERTTRIYLCFKIPNKEMKSVVSLLDKLETNIGTNNFKDIFKSITFDNGTEFKDFTNMERSYFINEARTKIYYANPYHSWERGSNENGNRMMRKFYPKGTDFSATSVCTIIPQSRQYSMFIPSSTHETVEASRLATCKCFLHPSALR